MPFYIGENKIVDRYIGDKLVVAAYKGEIKYFDAYSEITGTLPIIFKSRAAVALKNYLLHGTSEGAGVETENLCPMIFSHTGVFNDSGQIDTLSTRLWSNMIPVKSNEDYVISITGTASNDEYLVFNRVINYDINRNFISRTVLIPLGNKKTITTESNVAYIVLDIRTQSNNVDIQFEDVDTISVTEGSTAPTTYIPFGYQIPLTNTGENSQSSTYPLYIGPTKLGAEEYVDYQEQKVYKRTENLFNKDADTHYAYMTVSGGIFTTSGQAWNSMIAFAPIIGGNTYSVKIDGTLAGQNLLSVFSVDEPANSVSYIIDGESTYVNHGQVQTFTCTAPTTANWIAIHFYIGLNHPWENVNITIVNSDDIPSQHIPYIQPTDPPAPLPAITAYAGENRLTSTVETGEVDVKGRIRPFIYGFHVDPSISDPDNAITYLGDAVGKTPAAMGASTFSYGGWADAFFMPKPCMVKSDGTVDYYLDPNDYTKKADGTASDVADLTYDGNAMMEWPLIWYKYEGTSTVGEGYFYVANAKIDDSYHCWCNYDADGNIINHFYMAIYNGTGTTKLRSMSGVATTDANGCGGTTGSTEVTRATANNTTAKVEWYTDVFCDRMLINGLLILISKSLNSQAKFGNGLVTGGETGKNGYTTGSLDNKGLFWGDTTNHTAGVKVFGMENWWGFVWHRTAGCVGLANDNYAIKQTWSTVDGSTTTGYNNSGDGYIAAGTRPGVSGQYVKQMTYANDCYLPLFAREATATTYYCDYWYTNNTSSTYLLAGGSANSGFNAGMSDLHLRGAFGLTGWDIGTCLSLKPLAKQPYSPPLTPTDPPVPFPAITAYKGENTLSSTETLGEVTVKGRINELPTTP